MAVRAIEDRDLIHAFLTRDRVGSVYPLGYLDDAYEPWCTWWGAFAGEAEDELKYLLLSYRGLSVPVVVGLGDGRYVKQLLDAVYTDLPDHFYCHLPESHRKAFSDLYELENLKSMVRMILERDEHTPVIPDKSVVRLGHRDTAEIVSLYDHYPDNLFEPYQLESGLYFGVYNAAGGALVSIAGVHVASETHDVAVVGNVVTHPEYRRSGLAARVMGRLLNELFDRVSLVAVNPREGNLPALKTLEHFGFKPHHTYAEGLVRRRYA